MYRMQKLTNSALSHVSTVDSFFENGFKKRKKIMDLLLNVSSSIPQL